MNIFAPLKDTAESGSTSRSGNDTLTVETGVRIPYPIQIKKTAFKSCLFLLLTKHLFRDKYMIFQ